MGGWTFIQPRFRDPVRADVALTVVARHESGSPATGSQNMHEHEQQMLVEKALSL